VTKSALLFVFFDDGFLLNLVGFGVERIDSSLLILLVQRIALKVVHLSLVFSVVVKSDLSSDETADEANDDDCNDDGSQNTSRNGSNFGNTQK